MAAKPGPPLTNGPIKIIWKRNSLANHFLLSDLTRVYQVLMPPKSPSAPTQWWPAEIISQISTTKQKMLQPMADMATISRMRWLFQRRCRMILLSLVLLRRYWEIGWLGWQYGLISRGRLKLRIGRDIIVWLLDKRSSGWYHPSTNRTYTLGY